MLKLFRILIHFLQNKNMFIGGDGGDDSNQKEERQKIINERKRVKKLFGLSLEKRIRQNKKAPKCEQYLEKCEPGLQACKNLFAEFSKHIPLGEEEAKGE